MRSREQSAKLVIDCRVGRMGYPDLRCRIDTWGLFGFATFNHEILPMPDTNQDIRHLQLKLKS